MPNDQKIPLRVLILEDRAEDAELLLLELRKTGFTVDARRVEDEAGFQARLDADVDVILADYALPGYNALNALASLQKSGLDIPFIIVTGALSDEDAAACIQRGAADYLRKDRMARLGHAVAAALDQRHLRAEHRAMEQALRDSEQKYRLLFNKIRDPVFVVEVSADGRFGCMLEANDTACLRLGYAREALLKLALQDIAAPDRARILKFVAEKIMADDSLSFDTELVAKNGARMPVDMFLNRIDLNGKPAIMAIARDMSEIRKLEQKIYEIDEMEKQFFGQELHDSVGQYLTALAFRSKVLENRLKALDIVEAAEASALTKLVGKTCTHLCNLSKTLFPVELEKKGLEAALRTLVVFMETQFKATCKLDYQLPEGMLNILTTIHLYRIIQEALTNAVKHNQAHNIAVRLSAAADQIAVLVRSDGRPMSAYSKDDPGTGRDIMNYRARILNASIKYQESRNGGNEMILTLPPPPPVFISPLITRLYDCNINTHPGLL